MEVRKSRSTVGLPLFEMKGLMTVWKDIQTKSVCYSEHDNRSSIKMSKNNNLVSTAKVYSVNKYSEFTTFFCIPFTEESFSTDKIAHSNLWKEILSAWSEVCIHALKLRMDSCVSMLFRNRNNVVVSNESQIVFKKSNGQYHAFNHASFKAMEAMKEYLEKEIWKLGSPEQEWVRQLLKALYWIPKKDKQERGGYGFGQLISCLEEFTLAR